MRWIERKFKNICSNVERFFRVITYRKAIDDCDEIPDREAYVVFRSSKLVWVQYLLRDHYQHVSIIVKSSNKGWLVLDFYCIGIIIHEIDDKKFEQYLRVSKKKGDKIVKGLVRSNKIIPSFIPLLRVNNCVTFTKNFLGIRHFAVWTPHKLYKCLKDKYGYKEV